MTSIARWSHRVAAITLWGLVVLVVASLIGSGSTSAQGTHHAAIVIDFGGGQLTSSCVPFAEDEISGADLLRRSGASVVFTGFGGGLGAGVCEIDGQGCNDPGDCFCQCRGADCHYWSYWTLQDGAWHFQNVGAGQRDVHDGDADAWVWGDRRTPPDADLGYGDVCPVIVPTNAPLPRPTSNPGGNSNPQPTIVDPGPEPVATPPGGSNAEVSTPSATPRATEQVRRATEQVRRATTPIARNDRSDAAGGPDDGSGGAPVGLIAFAAIAGALVVGIGAFALRRRIHG
ncbi:MAG: hypothetical protein WEB04_09710 [Dehalococcoidia bacterium]